MVLDTKGGDVELMKGKPKAQVTAEKDAGGDSGERRWRWDCKDYIFHSL